MEPNDSGPRKVVYQVNVNQQTVIVHSDGPRSFEEALESVRRRRAQEPEQCATSDSADASLKT